MQLLLTMDPTLVGYALTALSILPFVSYCLVVTFYMISIFYSRCKLYKVDTVTLLTDELPGVSIIKPLMGIDPLLEVNLESHFSINYPKFELLFCVRDDDDPAIHLLNQIKERYPKVDCSLHVGGRDGVINPMVSNMAPGYDACKYDIVWVSTSRIKASTDILVDMVCKMMASPKRALVHQMPFTTDSKGGLAVAIEKIYFGATIARYYLAFNALGVNCFTGMSYLVRKPELDQLNGLAWFGKFLAEDFFLSKYLYERGFRHQVAAVPAQQNVNGITIAAYKDRMVRWLRLRLNMMPGTAAILEPLSESVPLGIFAAWAVWHLFNFDPLFWFFSHWMVWCCFDYIMLKGVQHGPLPFGKCTFVFGWMIRELLYVLVFFEAVLNPRRIKWGKRTYELSQFGERLEIVSNKDILPI